MGDNKEEDRTLHVSQIYTREDGDHLAMRAIAAGLCKMMKVMQSSFWGALDNLTKQMVLRLQGVSCGASIGVAWVNWKMPGSGISMRIQRSTCTQLRTLERVPTDGFG